MEDLALQFSMELGQQGQDYDPNCTMFVGDLSYFCTEEDLKALFSFFGKIVRVIVRRGRTGDSLMHGFMTMQTAESAKRAALTLDGKEFMGRNIRIQIGAEGYRPARPKDDLIEVHVSFMGKQGSMVVTEVVLRELFSPFGHIVDVAVRRHFSFPDRQGGYGFVYYQDPQAAFASIQAMKDAIIRGVSFECQISHKSEMKLMESQRGSSANLLEAKTENDKYGYPPNYAAMMQQRSTASQQPTARSSPRGEIRASTPDLDAYTMNARRIQSQPHMRTQQMMQAHQTAVGMGPRSFYVTPPPAPLNQSQNSFEDIARMQMRISSSQSQDTSLRTGSTLTSGSSNWSMISDLRPEEQGSFYVGEREHVYGGMLEHDLYRMNMRGGSGMGYPRVPQAQSVSSYGDLFPTSQQLSRGLERIGSDLSQLSLTNSPGAERQMYRRSNSSVRSFSSSAASRSVDPSLVAHMDQYGLDVTSIQAESSSPLSNNNINVSSLSSNIKSMQLENISVNSFDTLSTQQPLSVMAMGALSNTPSQFPGNVIPSPFLTSSSSMSNNNNLTYSRPSSTSSNIVNSNIMNIDHSMSSSSSLPLHQQQHNHDFNVAFPNNNTTSTARFLSNGSNNHQNQVNSITTPYQMNSNLSGESFQIDNNESNAQLLPNSMISLQLNDSNAPNQLNSEQTM